jgi:hypothetical protein
MPKPSIFANCVVRAIVRLTKTGGNSCAAIQLSTHIHIMLDIRALRAHFQNQRILIRFLCLG